MPLDLERHPCFNSDARSRFARIHLPVAPHCNVQCNFCKRVYDCANESRPGVTTAVLEPKQAIYYLESVLKKDPRIAVVGIAGPGDPFATPDRTLETLRLVRDKYPDMLLCVASNGLGVLPHVDAIAELNVSHVTVKRVYRGVAGASVLWERQKAAIVALKERGVTVKINTIVIPGVNDHHVPAIAKTMAELGADIANCVPLYPVADTPFAAIPSPTHEEIVALRGKVAEYVPIMEHCTRCRADAVGLLGEKMRPDIELCLLQSSMKFSDLPESRPYVAAATQEGVLVNQHLGEAEQIAVFAKTAEGFELVEMRRTPVPGGGTQRWLEMADILRDCRAILVASAGDAPRSALAQHGIQVVMMEGLIEEGLDAIYSGVPVRAPLRKQHRCGSGCAGNGMGCQ
jgi:nitrogen fixation protein NifB